MAQQTVFSDNLDPENGSLTSRFQNATAFYIDAPLLGAEMEIDVFLQVYFPSQSGEKLRNLRIGSLKNGEIKLNETDTETVVPIPSEFVDSGLEMAIFFTPSEPIFLEVYVLVKGCTVCQLKAQNTAIQNTLSDFQEQLNRIEAALEAVNADGVDAGDALETLFFLLQ